MLLLKRLILVSLVACGVVSLHAQDPEPIPEQEREYVSGNVIEISDTKIVVDRVALGKAEIRTFVITAETVIEGRLRNAARVTVGFKPTDEGDIAIRIIVRPQQSQKKP
jgi:hypothetical protein